MSKRAVIFGWILLIWLVTSLACGLPSAGQPAQATAPVNAEPARQGSPEAQPDPEASPMPSATATPLPTPTLTATPVPAQPVSMFSGLASLDSYQSTLRFYSAEPASQTLSETINKVQYNRAAKATRNQITARSSDEENPQVETSQQDQVTIDLETCSLEDGAWEYSRMEPAEKEILSIMSNLYDMLPVISNPVFIAQETKNNIPANHFSFEVETAGAESGSVVTKNQGEYWLAVDGQYLVAYSLHLELRDGPASDASARVNTLEIEYSLDSINQPVDLQLPPGCKP